MALPSVGLISNGEREWIERVMELNIRNDGRDRESFRAITLQLGVLAQASGSAQLKIGNTDVTVAVKVGGACTRAVQAGGRAGAGRG